MLIPGYWMAEGGQSATGALLHHIITSHAAYPKAKEEAGNKGITVFEYLNGHLEIMKKEANSPTLSHLTRYFHRKFNCCSLNISLSGFPWK